jgi:hypothetical protein
MADKQIPLMQQPGFVYRESKRVRADRLQPGDRIAKNRGSYGDPKWTVASTEVNRHGLVYVTYESGRRHAVGLASERIYIDRAAKDQ